MNRLGMSFLAVSKTYEYFHPKALATDALLMGRSPRKVLDPPLVTFLHQHVRGLTHVEAVAFEHAANRGSVAVHAPGPKRAHTRFHDNGVVLNQGDKFIEGPCGLRGGGQIVVGLRIHSLVDCAELGANHSNRSEERRVGKECRSRWSPY